MIDYRKDESHFLDACDAASVDATTKVSKALLRTSSHRHSAIIVRESGRPAWFVDGRKLAEVALKLSDEAAHEKVLPLDAPIADFLPHGRIGTTLDDLAFPISPNVQEALVDEIYAVPLGANATQRNIYPLIQKEGRLVGFLFSNEDYKARAATPPPTYICKRSHVNRDPDHGRCSFCPAKLTLQPAPPAP